MALTAMQGESPTLDFTNSPRIFTKDIRLIKFFYITCTKKKKMRGHRQMPALPVLKTAAALIQYKRSKFTYYFKFVIHMFDCNLTFFLFETYLYSIA